MWRRDVRRLRVEQAAVVGPKAQLDQGAGVGGDLRLPAVVRLIAEHGFLRRLVPDARGLTAEVMLADQRVLDGDRPLFVDAALSAGGGRFLSTLGGMMAGRTMMRAGSFGVLGFGLGCRACRAPSGKGQQQQSNAGTLECSFPDRQRPP